MQAAAQMSPEERQQMIRGMVEQLNDRLASEGGTAADWAKLISSLRMLGEEDRAQKIWTEAQGLFATAPDDLERIRQAAEGEVAQMPMAAPQAPMMPGPGLVDRLTTEGGAANEWARAISSLATLGKTDRAAEVYAAAQTALAGDEAALAMVKGAAEAAGVAQ
jgi:cytochrome c-type biogenesis protein CcmH